MHEAHFINLTEELNLRMSDDNLETQKQTPLETTGHGERKETSRKSALGGLNPELKDALSQALGSWENVSEQTQQTPKKKSAQDERLEDVKKLLTELKNKLNEFND